MSNPRMEIRPLTDALPDESNTNRHTARGAKLLENSMRRRGFFRPIAAAGKDTETPVIKAGNLTQETAVNIGLDKEAIFIYTDGTRPIVHVRTDIAPDSPEAAALAIEDNRAGEESLNWDIDCLAALAAGDSALLTALRREDKMFDGMLERMQRVAILEFGIHDDGRQGYSSPWKMVQNGKTHNVLVTIGDLETHLSLELGGRLVKTLVDGFENGGNPIHELLEKVIIEGLAHVEG